MSEPYIQPARIEAVNLLSNTEHQLPNASDFNLISYPLYDLLIRKPLSFIGGSVVVLLRVYYISMQIIYQGLFYALYLSA